MRNSSVLCDRMLHSSVSAGLLKAEGDAVVFAVAFWSQALAFAGSSVNSVEEQRLKTRSEKTSEVQSIE